MMKLFNTRSPEKAQYMWLWVAEMLT